MYAIIESGSKQYKVQKDDKILLERLPNAGSGTVKLDKVLLLSDGKKVQVGTPYLKGASVNCKVLGEVKAKKVISFKYRRRKASKAKIGHRQKYIHLEVKEIKTG